MAKAFQRSYKFLPEVFQTNLNRRFLASTMDHLITPSDARQLNYYVGRRYAKGATVTDRFLSESNDLRNAYQLEVGAAVKNADGTYEFGATVEDFINSLNYYGVDKNNLQKALADDFKPADFKINLDKLVNYDQYFWLPDGPNAVSVSFETVNDLFVKLSAFDSGTNGYYDDIMIYVLTANTPDPLVDTFPNNDVDRSIANLDVSFKFPRAPQVRQEQNQISIPPASMIGVATNGHPFYTYTMGSKEILNGIEYTINTVHLENNTVTFTSTNVSSGLEFDRDEDVLHQSPTEFAGHPDINGVFHYHAFTTELNDNVSGHSKILGYAFDGYPIYGPRAYTNANGTGSIILMTSSYRLKAVTAARGTPDGRYVEDYEYVPGLGTLDVNNGRFCVTPEFPNGTYAYFLTVDALGDPVFPYVLGPRWTGNPVQQDANVQIPTTATAFTGIPSIDIDRDIVGQQRFAIGNITFLNGLKVEFDGTVLPANYRNNTYYVEGVGTSIRLLNVDDMVPNLREQDINYGYENKHYITIARSSLDGNAWSRSNRWFHYRVLEHTAEVREETFVIDQTQKAKRPIVEFNSDLALYNHPRRNVAVVDAFDRVELDALSNVMAAQGYVADGVALATGMKIVFAADTDPLVRSKIYEVTIASLDEGRKSDYVPLSIGSLVYGVANSGSVFRIQGDFVNRTIELKNNGIVLEQDVDYSYAVTFNYPQKYITITMLSGALGTLANVELTAYDYQSNVVLTEVGTVTDYDGVMVQSGTVNYGKNFYYLNDEWIEAQVKNAINQEPLFDLFDSTGTSIGDRTVYTGSTFIGSKLLSFKRGTGTNDSEIGFPLSYKSVGLTGDIQFEWNHSTDTFSFTLSETTTTLACESFYALNVSDSSLRSVVLDSPILTKPPVIDLRYIDVETSEIDLKAAVDDSDVQQTILVELNDRLLYRGVDYDLTNRLTNTGTLVDGRVKQVKQNSRLVFRTPLAVNDKLLMTFWTSDDITNTDLMWRLPLSTTINSANDQISVMTFSELASHLTSGAQLLPNLQGRVIGNNNLYVQPALNSYCTKFGYHNGNSLLAMALLKNRTMGFVQSLEYARNEYTKFKNAVIQKYNTVEFDDDNPVPTMLDNILDEYTSGKTDAFSFYDSDMVPGYTNFVENTYTVQYQEDKTYPLTVAYVDSETSRKAVLVYHNGTLLTRYRDYDFDTPLPSLTIKTSYAIEEGDTIVIRQYDTTSANWIATTPAKLGLAFAHVPELTTVQQPSGDVTVIRGHDGSLTPAYGDQRDDLLLELERRIYNNIKNIGTDTHKQVLDKFTPLPGFYRSTNKDFQNYIDIFDRFFGQWILKSKLSFTTHAATTDPWEWNYRGQQDIYGNKLLTGSWFGVYRYYFDTAYPNKTPWEMLGFHEQPTWWQDEYGPAPYTNQNTKLWDDLEQGLIRQGYRAGVDSRYARYNADYRLQEIIPIDEHGVLVNPQDSKLVVITDQRTLNQDWQFGDCGPVEQAWIRSSEFVFAVQLYQALVNSRFYFGSGFDLLDTMFDGVTTTLQKVYDTTITNVGKVIRNSDIQASVVNNYTTGYFVWIQARARALNIDETDFDNFVSGICPRLMFRMTGFTDKDKLQVFINSVAPGSKNSQSLLPDSNYQLLLDQSSPIDTLVYSGVIVTKSTSGWRVEGYDTEKSYFMILPSLHDNGEQESVRVGEQSSSYLEWRPGYYYIKSQIVKYNDRFFRVTRDHTSTENFDFEYFAVLQSLPLQGGIVATYWKTFSTTPAKVYYGTVFRTPQEVFDFLIGYGRYLESQGFIFDEFDNNLGMIKNWLLSAKEFLFWTLQNWNVNAAITLSPSSTNIQVYVPQGDLDPLYGAYSDPDGVLDQNGSPLRSNDLVVDRNFDVITVSTTSADRTIYLLKAAISEYDHLVVFDDQTDFSDVVYNTTTGARQERLKIKGSKSNSWNGKLFAPGFTLDQASIAEWQSYTDYRIGDLIKIGFTTYSAVVNHNSDELFDYSKWKKLLKQPKKFLQPNLEFLAARLEQFYDLSSDQITSDVSSYARHLIAFQPRDYLASLLVDDESQFKFYQGMITQKGTEQAVTKLLRGINPTSDLAVDLKDEWALRVGEFGLADNTDEIEILLDQNDLAFARVGLDAVDNVYYDNNLIAIPNDKLLDTGERTVGNLFPLVDENFKQKYAGYARIDQVDATVLTEDDISTVNIDILAQDGSIIWVGKNALNSSMMYRTKKFGPFNMQIIPRLDDAAAGVLVDEIIALDQSIDLSPNEKIWILYNESDANTSASQLTDIPAINPYQVVNQVVSTTRFSVVNGTGLDGGEIFNAFIIKLLPAQYDTFNTVAFYQISAATNTSVVEVTLSTEHEFIDGEKIIIDRVNGMIELNGKAHFVKVITSTSIELYEDIDLTIPVNSQTYATYVSGGVVYTSHIRAAERVYDSVNGDRLWIDLYDGGWAVLKKQDPWTIGPQPEGLEPPTVNFSLLGTRLHAWTYKSIIWMAARAENTILPGNTNQSVLIYERSEAKGDLSFVKELRGDTPAVDETSEFGYSISNLDDTTLIIGAPANDLAGTDRGSVQVWTRDDAGDWNAAYTVSAPIGADNAKFGTSLARISDTLMLVGAPGEAMIYALRYGSFNLPVRDVNNAAPTTVEVEFGWSSGVTATGNPYLLIPVAQSVAGVQIGTQISGSNIAANSVILAIEENYSVSNHRIKMSRPATGSGTMTVVYLYHGLSDGQPIVLSGISGVVQSNSNSINGVVFYVEKVDEKTVRLYEEASLSTGIVVLNSYVANTGVGAITNSYSIQIAPNTQSLAAATNTGITMAADANKVAITDNSGNGRIYLYTIDSDGILTQDSGATIAGTTAIPIKSQHPIDITTLGENVRIAVGSRFTTYDTFGTIIDTGGTTFDTSVPDGIVRIYDFITGFGANLMQVLTGPKSDGLNLFGKTVKFTSSGKLLVGNPTAPYLSTLVIDAGSTLFDDSTTTFTDLILGYGAVESYGLHSRFGTAPNSVAYSSQYVWEGSVFNPVSVINDATTGFSAALTEINDTVFVGSPWSDQGKVYEFDNTTDGWVAETQQTQLVDTRLINRALSYDPVQDQVVEFIPLWDPLKDLHDSEALINIDYTLPKDPASYLTSGNSNTYWAKEKVGTIWWDNSTAIWLWYEQGDLAYKMKNWGKLFPGSTITVCEWVESTVAPSLYNVDGANPALGVPPQGIGQPYNTVVTTDANGANVFKYYFWVAGKQTIANASKKSLSAGGIATALTVGPYQWVAAAGHSSLITQNLRDNLADGQQILQVEVLRTEQVNPRHVEWTLLSENDDNSPPDSLVAKMIDSLTGRDLAGNLVPDISLPAYKRYGIKIRPRQSMFVDRITAIETSSEFLNQELAQIIIEDIDLGTMNAADPEPLVIEIQDVLIDEGDTEFDDGSTTLTTEYQNWNESVPSYADIIVGDLLAKAPGYRILVENDETRKDLWTIYEWDSTNLNLVRVQKYDTTRYWSRVDYYSADFPAGSIPDLTLATEQEFLDGDYTGQKVKVLGPGYWRVLTKDTAGETTILAMQNGTIRLNITASDFDTSMSFDTSSFDSAVFDSEPTIELRNILTALRDSIFVNEYKNLWSTWFFRMVRYALLEQRQLDWAFKSSFIKVKHYVADLVERPVYSLAIDDSLEKYIKEVKPYHTKIREYTNVYSGNEVFGSLSTDFDCPPHLNGSQYVVSDVNDPEQADRFANEWPWRSYRDNRGYSVVAIVVTNGGSGYDIAPTIRLNGGETVLGGNVRLASAEAAITGATQSFVTLGDNAYFSARKIWLDEQAEKDNAIVTSDLPGNILADLVGTGSDPIKRITILDAGEGYLTPPTVEIVSLPGHGSGATAYAVLGESPVRMFKTGLRFDRIKGTADILYSEFRNPALDNPYFDDWHAADRVAAFYDPQPGQAGLPERISVSYSGDGVTTTFDLPQDFMYEELLQVAVKQSTDLDTEYELVDTADYTVYPSELQVEFDTAPADGSTVKLILNPPQLPILLGADYDLTKIVGPKFTSGPGFESQARGFDSVEFDNWELDPYGNLVELGGYDTYQNGGRFVSVTGYDPSQENINSGGSFIGPETTPSTEELVSGQVFDTLDFKVFSGAGNQKQDIDIQTFVGDGAQDTFPLAPVPKSYGNITVFVNGVMQEPNIDGDTTWNYELDYTTLSPTSMSCNLVFAATDVPPAGSIISVVVVEDEGPTVEQVQNFVGNGTTTVFVVSGVEDDPSPGGKNSLRACITIVDGVKVANSFANNGDDLDVTISPAPAASTAVKIIVYQTTLSSKNYTEGYTETIAISGPQYFLANSSGTAAPISASTIVYVAEATTPSEIGMRLAPPDIAYYVSTGSATFALPECPGFNKASLVDADVQVVANGVELTPTVDYAINVGLDNVTLSVAPGVGDLVTVTVLPSGDYYFLSGALFIDDTDLLSRGITKLTVQTYNDMSLNGMVTEVFGISLGLSVDSTLHVVYRGFGQFDVVQDNYDSRSYIELKENVTSINRVQVYKNGQYLRLGTDWYFQPGSSSIINIEGGIADGDRIVVHYFGNSTTSSTALGFRIFKDMLGNINYYRMPVENSTEVAQPVTTTSTIIYVANSSVLDNPSPGVNRPGVVMIGKERVEYMEKGSGYITRLRRGTKGTGAAAHPAGTLVVDMGHKNLLPPSDNTNSSTYTADGTTASYALPLLMSTTYYDTDSVLVYVGGKRVTSGYTVDVSAGSYYQITFTQAPKSGLRIVIVVKQASNWYVYSPGETLDTTMTVWAEFIREKPSVVDIS